MQFLKCVKVALLISGAVFTITSLPAVRLANERIDIQLNQDEVFSGELRDFSGAYLSLAGLVSVSLGAAGFSLAAWRQTGCRLQQTKLTIAELESLIQQREQQLQAAQLAPAKLKEVGLEQFLDDDAPLALSTASPPVSTQQADAQAVSLQPTPVVTMTQTRQSSPMTDDLGLVMDDGAPSVQSLHQLLVAQASQLQAVQAQLQLHQQQREESSLHLPSMTAAVAPSRQPAGLSTGGFTVINPYQVQAVSPSSRRPKLSPTRKMA